MPYPSIRSSRATTRRSRILAGVLPQLVVLLGLAVPAAHAAGGTYGVRACHGDGVNNSWTPYTNGPYTGTHAECPERNPYGGLHVRQIDANGYAPHFANAGFSFDAPPGTVIDELHFDAHLTGLQGWQAGIWDWSQRDWVWGGPGWNWTLARRDYHVGGLRRTSVTAMVVCAASSCPAGAQTYSQIGLSNVTVRLIDLWDPSVEVEGGDLVSPGWKQGVRNIEVAGSDNAGIRTLQVGAQGELRMIEPLTCDWTLKIPCSNRQSTLQVDTTKLDDGPHTLGVQAIDASGNVAATSQQIQVDNRPPGALRDLTAASDWQRRNAFEVRWTNPSQRNVAPITAAGYQLCPLKRSGSCTPVRTASGTDLQRMTVAVPGPGEWSLRTWLIDAAGNQNDQTAREATLRLDETPPELQLLPFSPDDPGRIAVKASDATSGLDHGEIELRREGSSVWRSLQTAPTEEGFAAYADDEALPKGTYVVRARARDNAGNEQSTDANAVTLTLPVRASTRLRVGKVRRVKARRAGERTRRRIFIARPLARHGHTTTLIGRLRAPGGNPLAGRDVIVSELVRLPGATWRPAASVRTSARGWLRYRAPAGPSRLVRFRFPGTSTIQGRTRIVDLRVRAFSTFLVSRRNAVNGQEVTFRGRVLGEPIPSEGKLLQLQVYARGEWLTFATPRANPRGRWRWPYRFTATRGLTRYRFRVRIPVENGYPYVPGASRTVRVKVRGL